MRRDRPNRRGRSGPGAGGGRRAWDTGGGGLQMGGGGVGCGGGKVGEGRGGEGFCKGGGWVRFAPAGGKCCALLRGVAPCCAGGGGFTAETQRARRRGRSWGLPFWRVGSFCRSGVMVRVGVV